MQSVETRIFTFQNSTFSESFKIKLAEAGFIYTGSEDTTKCTWCGLEIFKWLGTENPTVLHDKYSPSCLSTLKRFYTPLETRVLSFKGWTNSLQDPLKMAKAGFFFLGKSDLVQCFMCYLRLDSWTKLDDPFVSHYKFNKKCAYKYTEPNDKNEEFLCKICMDNPREICFIPCGHIISCIKCNDSLKTNCPICNTTVKQCLRVFI